MGKSRAWAPHVRWTDDEVAILMQHYHQSDWSVLLGLLPNRSRAVIQCKANGLGLARYKKPRRTEEETRKAKRESMAKRRAADLDGSREYHRKRHFKNHERNKEAMRRYAARRFFWVKSMKLRGADRATPQDLARLWKQQKGLCALTGRRLDRTAQLDHCLPRARGGGDQITNLQWLCKEANLAKNNLTDQEFAELCGSVMRWIGHRIARHLRGEA